MNFSSVLNYLALPRGKAKTMRRSYCQPVWHGQYSNSVTNLQFNQPPELQLVTMELCDIVHHYSLWNCSVYLFCVQFSCGKSHAVRQLWLRLLCRLKSFAPILSS